jgi:uncharacterized protein YlzI (FlbEa/FlbD family)
MIKLVLDDGSKAVVNPNAISFMRKLPDDGDKPEKTLIVMTNGHELRVRPTVDRILLAMGEFKPKKNVAAAATEPADED